MTIGLRNGSFLGGEFISRNWGQYNFHYYLCISVNHFQSFRRVQLAIYLVARIFDLILGAGFIQFLKPAALKKLAKFHRSK